MEGFLEGKKELMNLFSPSSEPEECEAVGQVRDLWGNCCVRSSSISSSLGFDYLLIPKSGPSPTE